MHPTSVYTYRQKLFLTLPLGSATEGQRKKNIEWVLGTKFKAVWLIILDSPFWGKYGGRWFLLMELSESMALLHMPKSVIGMGTVDRKCQLSPKVCVSRETILHILKKKNVQMLCQ